MDKDSNNLSYPERHLKRISTYESIINNLPADNLPNHYEVLYRVEDDPLVVCNTADYYTRLFVNLDMAKNYNISLFDFFSLTKTEIDLLTEIAKDKIDYEAKMKSKLDDQFSKGKG